MDDISKRKRPHTTVHSSRDIVDNRSDIKRQRNRALPNEMCQEMSNANAQLYMAVASSSSPVSLDLTCTEREDDDVFCSASGTEQIQSKLGELRLSQLPELSSIPRVPAETSNGRVKYRRLMNMTDIPSPSYDESVSVSEKSPGFSQHQVNRPQLMNEALVYHDEPSTSNLPDILKTSNSPSNEMHKPNDSCTWLQYDVAEVVEDEATSRQVQKLDMDQLSRNALLDHDDNQNFVKLPSMTNGSSGIALGIENNNLFSVSPDMNALLNSDYSGLPLIPVFATRQINSLENFELEANIPRQAPLNDSTDLDDEGFDEPTETHNSAIHCMTLNSDVEEDFA